MTNLTDDIEALLESEEKVQRAREAEEDNKKIKEERLSPVIKKEKLSPQPDPRKRRGIRDLVNDSYSADREENDKRRSRKSGDGSGDVKMEDVISDGSSANGSDRPRRASFVKLEGEGTLPPRKPVEPQIMRPNGDYYDGGGRPGRIDEYRPGSRGERDGRRRHSRGGRRSRSPPRGQDKYRSGLPPHRSPPRRDRSPPRRGRGGGRGPAPEPTDDDSDRRTVFVSQLVQRLRTKELSKFFERAGEVVEAQIVKDRVSGRSKGVGYVEFKDEASVEKAIALTGQKLLDQPIIAQLTEAEKNRQARTEGSTPHSNGVPFHRLYVGNIHFSINEDDLKNVFEPFGELEFVQLQKEEHTGRSKGYGFVQYHDPQQAKEALDKMNGFELAGRAIRVGLGNDKFTHESTQHILRAQAPSFTGSSFSGMGGRGAHAGGQANFDRAGGRDAEKSGGASALDDTDVGGVNFSNYSRDSLMRKLARTEDPEPKVQSRAAQPKKAAPVTQAPVSRCVLLKNMYNQAEETDANWQDELKEDVKTECTDKYGKVVHIGLVLDNNDGEIYIKFDRAQGGENAIRGLNGRWFGGRMISAEYVIEAMYNANFPKAKNL